MVFFVFRDNGRRDLAGPVSNVRRAQLCEQSRSDRGNCQQVKGKEQSPIEGGFGQAKEKVPKGYHAASRRKVGSGCVAAGQVFGKDGQRYENKQSPAENAWSAAGGCIIEQIVMGVPGAAGEEVFWQISFRHFRFNLVGVASEARACPRVLPEHAQGLLPYFEPDFHAGVQVTIMEQ